MGGRVRSIILGRRAGLAKGTTIRHQSFYSKGSYSAYSYLFAATSLTLGTDYDANWTLRPGVFPSQSVLSWYTPKGAVPGGSVWGFCHLDYGNYDAGNQQTPITPRQVCNINTFATNFSFSFSGSQYFNLLHELWLAKSGSTTASNSQNAYYEIGFFLHNNDYSFHTGGTPIGGIHVNNGISYTVRSHGTYITFAQSSSMDVLSGSIDWKAALLYLVANGVISGSEWVNGVSLGVEPQLESGSGNRSGQLTIPSYSGTMSGTSSPAKDYLGANILTSGDNLTAWTLDAMTSITGQADMDGGSSAIWLQETSATGNHGIHQTTNVTVPTAQHNYTLFGDFQNTKGRDSIEIYVASGDFSSQFAMVYGMSALTTTQDTIVGTGITLINKEIVAIGSNWYRPILSFSKAVGITTLFVSFLSHNGTTTSYTGDTTKGLIARPTFRLVQIDALAISGTPADASQNAAYTFTPTVTNGTSPFSYSLVGTLPTGLSFNTSTGVISGTPTAVGTIAGIIITVIDANGLNASTPSLSITTATPVAPTNSVVPTLTNPSVQATYVVQGQTLSVSTGTWAGAPAPSFSYQWKRTGANISGATSATYVVQAIDDAAAITCTVTATNTSGSASAGSGSVTAIAGTLRLNEPFNSQGSWASSAGISWTGGKLVVTNSTQFNGSVIAVAGMTPGKTLRIIFDQTVVDSGDAFLIYVQGATGPTGTQRNTSGTFTDNITIPSSPTQIGIQTRAANCDGTFDNILAVELP